MFIFSVSKIWDNDINEISRVLVWFDGTVRWAPAGEFQSSCKLNMLVFPYDTQACHMDFGNTINPDQSVRLFSTHTYIDLSHYNPSNEYDLENTTSGLKAYPLQGASIHQQFNITAIRFSMTLRRQPMYYILTIFIPTAILTILILLVFLLPVESGEKIGLGITILLAFSVYMLILSDITPHTSENLPFLGKY